MVLLLTGPTSSPVNPNSKSKGVAQALWTEIKQRTDGRKSFCLILDAVPFRSHHTMTRVCLLLVGLFVGLIVCLFVCYYFWSWCSSVPVRSLHALMFVSSYVISL